MTRSSGLVVLKVLQDLVPELGAHLILHLES